MDYSHSLPAEVVQAIAVRVGHLQGGRADAAALRSFTEVSKSWCVVGRSAVTTFEIGPLLLRRGESVLRHTISCFPKAAHFMVSCCKASEFESFVRALAGRYGEILSISVVLECIEDDTVTGSWSLPPEMEQMSHLKALKLSGSNLL
jgi:hypothetical protein